MYVCFVDFSKPLDSIPHSLLWYQKMKSGIHGKSMRVMQSMYENLRSCVRTQGGLTHYFDCSVGTRQACMLSSFLFASYIGKLVDMLKNNYGIFITEELSHLNILLYADDIALFADSVKRLQELLNTLSEMGTCCKHKQDKNYNI